MRFLILIFLFSYQSISAQQIVRDIKWFGAKGDGKTNDHLAFQKAALFFNKRGGNGKLIIPKGVYIIGQQTFHKNTITKAVYEGSDAMNFQKVTNFIIEGVTGTILKYSSGLRYGTFDPKTGLANKNGNNFFQNIYAAMIGNAISITESKNVQIRNIELDGNSGSLITGGIYGDYGIQLPHSGIYIINSSTATVDKIKAHHFGLDGIIVSNTTEKKSPPDKIVILNSAFEYNARQGLSWVGGNDLTVINSKFNHTGKGKFMSPPGAGVDIEAEVGTISNGNFVNCEFINNAGNGLVADSGPGGYCTFTNSIFWGISSWSIWVNKPGFVFSNCKIYGSVVHGYDAKDDNEATKFISCLFEDKPYNNQEPYGSFLIETNYRRRMRFENCTLIANKKKLFWMETNAALPPEEKYQMINCTIIHKGKNLSMKVFADFPFINIK